MNPCSVSTAGLDNRRCSESATCNIEAPEVFRKGGCNRNAVSLQAPIASVKGSALPKHFGRFSLTASRARVSAKHGLACVGRVAQTKPSGSVEAKQLERGGTAPRAVDSLTENERLWFDSFPIQRDRSTLQNGTAELTLTGMGIAFPNAQPHSAAID